MESMHNLAQYRKKHVGKVLSLYFEKKNWPRLRGRTFLVWTVLLLEEVPVVGISSVSYGRIREMTGLGSNSTLTRAIDELTEKGYIRVLEVGGQGNQPRVYQLLHHRLPGAEAVIEHGSLSDKVCGILEDAPRILSGGESEVSAN